MAGIERWLVSDPTAGWDIPQGSALLKVGSFIGNLSLEVIRALPRIALIFVGSLIFAELLMLSLFPKAIDDEVDALRRQATGSFSEILRIDWETEATAIREDITRQAGIISDYDKAATTLNSSLAPKQADLQTLINSGRYWVSRTCYNSAGRAYRCGYVKSTAAINLETDIEALRKQAGIDPATRLNAQKLLEFDNLRLQKQTDSVSGQLPDEAGNLLNPSVTTLMKDIQEKYRGQETSVTDDLLTRYKAFGMLVNPETGACKPASSTASAVEQAQARVCVPAYSPDMDKQSTLWRYFLLFFEMMPIGIKLVRSISPITGYGKAMKDAEVAIKAKSGGLRDRAVSRAARKSAARSAMDEAKQYAAMTENEIAVREVSKYRRVFRLDDLRTRFQRASEATPPEPRKRAQPQRRQPRVEDEGSSATPPKGGEESLFD